MVQKSSKALALYLAISFGTCWGIGSIYILFSKQLIPVIGELTLMHPLAILALYSPSIAGLIVYFVHGGKKDLLGAIGKLVPRRKDLLWFPALFAAFLAYWFIVRGISSSTGIETPSMTLSLPEMALAALRVLITETGLIGGMFGWIGFLLPCLQGKLKNNVAAGLLTGLAFGLWVLPGYLIATIGANGTSYLLYVIQLMVFMLFSSFIFNATRGNILMYVFSFWLAATGSQLKFYYFRPGVQLIQIFCLIAYSALIAVIIKSLKIKSELQVYPDFLAKAESV